MEINNGNLLFEYMLLCFFFLDMNILFNIYDFKIDVNFKIKFIKDLYYILFFLCFKLFIYNI